MKRKRIIYSELAYFAGIFILALGTAFMEKTDFGISMIVAPAYLIYLKALEYLPFFSFGMSEYLVQAVLLFLLSCIMGKFKKIYFLSFVTAFFYGIVLDLAIDLVALFPYAGIGWQVSFYLIGMVTCAMGVVLLLHTYFPPEAYELVVKELSQKFHISFGITKTIYDYCSCALAVVLSLSFFGTFVGVKWGTFFCALLNGWLIGKISSFLEREFIFWDMLSLRKKLQ